jgi:hypothetical protein
MRAGPLRRMPRRWPIATVSVLAVTIVLTVLQFPFPEVRLALWRDSHALAAGQWWLLLYLGCGVVGQAFGYLWEPPDAGASVAAAGLLGAVSAWLLSPAGPHLARVRVWGVVSLGAGIALTAGADMHGPPLLLGFGLGALLLWRDRRSGVGAERRFRGGRVGFAFDVDVREQVGQPAWEPPERATEQRQHGRRQ